MPDSAGTASSLDANTTEEVPSVFVPKSASLPFGQELPLSSIGGPTYVTPQTLVQQVAYTLSDKLFTYSPETFHLDVAAKKWQQDGSRSVFGQQTEVREMEARAGAGSIALGHMFSKDFDLARRHIPQSIITSAATLGFLRPALEQLSLLYSVASPLVVHVAAIDYAPGSSSGLVTDYTSAMSLAEELDLGLVSSTSAYESQHMSLLASLLASAMPSLHAYDGITVGRETARVIDVLDQSSLQNVYETALKSLPKNDKKHADPAIRAVNILKAFNDELGTEYKPFEYDGHETPDSVLVVFGTVEASLSAQVAARLARDGVRVGVVNARMYRPFVEEAFFDVLPSSVSQIAVLGQVRNQRDVSDSAEHSLLYTDVLGAVTFSALGSSSPDVVDVKYAREETLTLDKMIKVFASMASYKTPQEELHVLPSDVKQYSFWDTDDSPSVSAPIVFGQLLSSDQRSNVTVRTGHDNFVQGGTVRTDIRSSSKSIEAAYSVSAASVAYVGNEKLLGEFDVIHSIKRGGVLVARVAGAKDEDLEKKIPAGMRRRIVAKELSLIIFDPSASSKLADDPSLETLIVQLAFLRIDKGRPTDHDLKKLASLNGTLDLLTGFSAELNQVLRQVKVPEDWAKVEPEVESISLPTDINVNSFSSLEKVDPEPESLLKDWAAVAKGLSFKEAYGTVAALRPDLGIKTCVVHVKEHKRLTPLAYDRNIFHIEFDLGDSGLKYQIGEALGIHAENDPREIEDFIKWYGLNPDEVVEVPTREDSNVLENRTVYQALLQNVDIFGRPPKRFYEALSEFATDAKEKENLLTLSTPDGATEFKRRAEVDTITFADILLEFPSAHPSFNDIARIVSPMKRREYSIASSQRVQPNSVSLLIVTVGWVDPRGRDRFGQATRYLDRLPVGAPVTVSVKPSVMKLPLNTKAPIIMAGLGTGLAPFRAFVQERALQRAEGHEIGAVMLYMGSRHQLEEYLYGEEWEAYQAAGVITLLGRAFSRDQPQKVYIQDRMRQTMEEIRQSYLRDGGSFYLCGPTWPVPDVTEVLQEAHMTEEKSKGVTDRKKLDGRRAIEQLKDEGRYVLEVY